MKRTLFISALTLVAAASQATFFWVDFTQGFTGMSADGNKMVGYTGTTNYMYTWPFTSGAGVTIGGLGISNAPSPGLGGFNSISNDGSKISGIVNTSYVDATGNSHVHPQNAIYDVNTSTWTPVGNSQWYQSSGVYLDGTASSTPWGLSGDGSTINGQAYYKSGTPAPNKATIVKPAAFSVAGQTQFLTLAGTSSGRAVASNYDGSVIAGYANGSSSTQVWSLSAGVWSQTKDYTGAVYPFTIPANYALTGGAARTAPYDTKAVLGLFVTMTDDARYFLFNGSTSATQGSFGFPGVLDRTTDTMNWAPTDEYLGINGNFGAAPVRYNPTLSNFGMSNDGRVVIISDSTAKRGTQSLFGRGKLWDVPGNRMVGMDGLNDCLGNINRTGGVAMGNGHISTLTEFTYMQLISKDSHTIFGDVWNTDGIAANAGYNTYIWRLGNIVYGKLTFQNYDGRLGDTAANPAAIPVTVTAYDSSGNLLATQAQNIVTDPIDHLLTNQYATALNPDAGMYAIDCGSYVGPVDIYIQGGTFLAKHVSTTITSKTVSGVVCNALLTQANATLLNGDIDGNNVVNINDYAILSDSFNTTPTDSAYVAAADLDKNGIVNINDYSTLSDNFNLHGDMH